MKRLSFLPQDGLEWQTLALSLALAITVHARATAGNPNAERQFVLGAQEVRVQNLPSDYEMVDDLEFEVTLVGSPMRLDTLDLAQDVEALLTFRPLPEGSGMAEADLSVRTPAGIRVKQSNPRRELVRVQRLEEREMDVIVFQHGRLPTGVQLIGRPTAVPPTVVASGPIEVMAGLRSVEVDVNLGTVVRSASLERQPLARDATGRALFGISFKPELVTVAIEAETVRESRLVPVIPDATGTLASGYALASVSVSPAMVVVEGPVELIRALDAVRTAPIDLSGLDSAIEISAPLAPPAGTTTDSDEVTVSIEVEEIFGELLFEGVPVGLRGGPEGIPYSVVPPVVDLVIQGPVFLLAELDRELVLGQIRAEVLPCDSEVQRECSRIVQVVLPPGLSVKERIPDRVDLHMGEP